ncbi:TPM domain-containing protein [Methylosinus sp. PW1]|uniref:TPM domain-containing protein n=1 Tax=Methylosinus sp. PW1 TaxID=107636 RepID=UPI000568F7B6|nr:TPM domain-containing protein [Methylosinus sp. PW1]
MPISDADKERIAEAIAAAERRTAGEIVCVLARRSSDYAYVPPLLAALIALIAPWPLVFFTELGVRLILAIQILVFIGAALLFSLPPLRLALTPRFVKRERAHRAAIEQFFTRGVSATKERTGVLIFVSLGERYARIVADEGIAAKIPQEDWRAALDLLLARVREGRIADGFVDAIGECARLLSKHVPPGGHEELPDRIYVI